MKYAIFIFLSLLILGPKSYSTERGLLYSISETTSPPLYFSPENQKKSHVESQGILHDLGEAFAAELHLKAHINVVPRGRIAMMLLYHETDLYCYTRPDWLEHSSELRWSLPIFSDRNIIATRKETPAAKDLAELKGQTVATVIGFLYPELGEPFPSAGIVRSDSPNVETTMTKLELKRVDYALMEELYFKHYLKTHPKSDLNPNFFVLRSFDVYCALSPKAPFTPKEFNGAVERLTTAGKIQKILNQYQ